MATQQEIEIMEKKLRAQKEKRLSDVGDLAILPPEDVTLGQFDCHGEALRKVDPIKYATIQRNLLVSFIQSQMIKGQDYGLIPGCGQKSALFKSGAERITTLFNFSTGIDSVDRFTDWDKGFFAFTYKATVRDSRGRILAECVGNCNSKESKYIKQDSFSIVNTIEKMAQKRAIVGAVILACNASGLLSNAEAMTEREVPQNRPQWATIDAEIVPEPKIISEAQRKRFFAIANQSGYTKPAIKAWLLTMGIESTSNIELSQYDLLCKQAENAGLAEFWNAQVQKPEKEPLPTHEV
jgi:hypothetical protein